MEDKVIQKRKAIFDCNNFMKFKDILDEMNIPEVFNYKDCIPKIFFNIDYDKIKLFNIGPYKKLYEEMKAYAKQRKIENINNIILLVHPFYPLLRHANFMIEKSEYFDKYIEYEKNLFNILNDNKNEIILFESPDCFARYTYNIYDKYSNIKRVIFTEHSKGKLLDNEEKILEKFVNQSNLRIAGCYRDYCINGIKSYFNEEIMNIEKCILDRAYLLNKKKVVLVGGATGREHIIAKEFIKDNYELSAILWANNEFIKNICNGMYFNIDLDDVVKITQKIKLIKPDFVFIGQGEPIQKGLCDLLKQENIKYIGPTKNLAKIEGSKTYCRKILEEIDPELNPKYKHFDKMNQELIDYIFSFQNKIVVKCDSVISGPRVRIFGVDEKNKAIENAQNWIEKYGDVIIEEYIKGNEVAFMTFTDGKNLIHSPFFKNHKRVKENDEGDNTSGMGTYTGKKCFPYITEKIKDQLYNISENVLLKINKNNNDKYIGCLYGEFLIDGNKIKVIEYNCRFGNPSSMNIISVMNISFAKFCEHIINQKLNELKEVFNENIISLSVYVVPKDYTISKKYIGTEVDFSQVDMTNFFCGNMDFKDNKYYLKNSRAFALCLTSDTMKDAREIIYNELSKVKGDIFYRKDIGKHFE